MLCAMIGSGLAGLLCGLNGVMANGIGVGGLPGILSIFIVEGINIGSGYPGINDP
jgi:phosphotransferase system  glucose/maltose/N-acetylglucosamine-specific IIC component